MSITDPKNAAIASRLWERHAEWAFNLSYATVKTNAADSEFTSMPVDLAELARIVDQLKALPPVCVRIEAPGEVMGALRAMCRQEEMQAGSPSGIVLELNDDLPQWTYRCHMSDGTHVDHRAR